MKTTHLFIVALLLGSLLSFSVSAQEEAAATAPAAEEEGGIAIDAGMDIYSSYIWRGAKFGSGPALQPWIEAGAGGLAIGAWGSVNSSTDEAYEMDLYLGYSFDFGLSLTVTDYYFGASDPTTGMFYVGEYFDYENAHYIEPSLGFETGDLSILAAYMIGNGVDDMYFELGYALGDLSIAIGAGDGAYTSDGKIMLCNVSLGTSKEIKITESYSLPLSGAVTLNPSTEAFYISVGISF